MTCPNCGESTVHFAIPTELQSYLPDTRKYAAICSHCLYVSPKDDQPATDPDFRMVSDTFPSDRNQSIVLVCLLALLDSPALYRDELSHLVHEAERRGIDPMLVLERLANDSTVDPHLRLDRRIHQLDEMLS